MEKLPFKVKDRTGLRFGRLVVQSFAGIRKPRSLWLCACDCGKTTTVTGTDLSAGNTKSCGCLKKTIGYTSNMRHGHSAGGKLSPTYAAWRGMRQRCEDENCKSFPDYGARGIEVCARWRDFANFLSDMGEKPDGMSIEREDVNGNYEPGNCRWATKAEQAQNTRKTVWLIVDGDRVCQAEAARRIGMKPATLHRYRTAGRLPARVSLAP